MHSDVSASVQICEEVREHLHYLIKLIVEHPLLRLVECFVRRIPGCNNLIALRKVARDMNCPLFIVLASEVTQ